ncbi:MAG: hypothetical protein REH79_01205 [Spiroplasma sp.]|nr:hypothetical protein [Spiroplasma sp.]
MRKLMKLMTITTVASVSAVQVLACSNDSQYENFINDINDSEKNNTAFFGFLGSADSQESIALYDIFSYLNQSINNQKSLWQNWITEQDATIKNAGLTNIYLKAYQGPPHDPKPSDPIDSFWNDKNISWQKNIFNWVYGNTKGNSNYHTPQGVSEVTEIEVKKDDKDNDMFKNLPIVFIIKKGQLITAGQNWISTESNRPQKIEAVKTFVLTNLFLPS